MKPPFLRQIQLFIVYQITRGLNFILFLLNKFLFRPLGTNPQNILIYKIGNIGDIVCAVPSFIAIRKNYPQAEITLLTSPGPKGSVGVIDFLKGAWYFDKIENYYLEDIDTFKKKLELISRLRKNSYDLFVQLPDDWTKFRTLLRNIFFAKLIGAKTAFGFYLRSSWLFRKSQIDYSPLYSNEVESLLFLLKRNGVNTDEVKFDFPITQEMEAKVEKLLGSFRLKDDNLFIGLGPGAKFSSKEWPLERFIEISRYLFKKYNARFVAVGGSQDIEKGEKIQKSLGEDKVLNLAGKLSVLETLLVLKKVKFLLSNDTGTVHLAAAVSTPCVALYSVRSPFGKWFPYGKEHKILYHKFLNCDYKNEECVKKSIEMISVEETIKACEEIINKLSR